MTVAPHWVEPGPVFTVWFCVQVIVHAATAVLHCENFEVLPEGSVAVAVMTFWPAGTATGKATLKLALQSGLAAVVTVIEPRKV